MTVVELPSWPGLHKVRKPVNRARSQTRATCIGASDALDAFLIRASSGHTGTALDSIGAPPDSNRAPSDSTGASAVQGSSQAQEHFFQTFLFLSLSLKMFSFCC